MNPTLLHELLQRYDRIVFLDIDGVLNTPKYVLHHGIDGIDPMKVDFLDWILDETGAAVVISSAWRTMTKDKERAFEEIKGQLASIGYMKHVDRVIDFTPQVLEWKVGGWKDADRGWEIDLWLRMTEWPGDFVVLDDTPIGLHVEHLVRTEEKFGLTLTKAREVVEMFKRLREAA